MQEELEFRKARRSDVPTLVTLLAEDVLGASRESSEDLSSYEKAFDEIDADSNNELIVVQLSGEVVGCLQLTFIRHLTYQGGRRAQIEGVRMAPSHRGYGLGAKLVRWTIERAKSRGCHLLQLTTDVRRPEALEFYLSLGFEQTHHGLKLHFE